MKSVLAFLLSIALIGCGAGLPTTSTLTGNGPQFINQTGEPNAQVFPIWQAELNQAADYIGIGYQGVPGAPVVDLYGNIVSTPSPELNDQVQQIASSLRGIIVETAPDVPASVLNAQPNCLHCPYSDPTGIIYCPPNAEGVMYCEAYTKSFGDIVVPEGYPQYFGPYEIMITLLHYLGKNTQNM